MSVGVVVWGTGTPKDRDEVYRREVSDVMGECFTREIYYESRK
jgi:hypothetical protein